MRARALMSSAAATVFDAPTSRLRVLDPQEREPELAPRSVPRIDAGAVAILLLGAVVKVSFQSFGSVSFFDRHFASATEGWPKAGMYGYLYWFGSSVAWLFILPVLIIAAIPGARTARLRLRPRRLALRHARGGGALCNDAAVPCDRVVPSECSSTTTR